MENNENVKEVGKLNIYGWFVFIIKKLLKLIHIYFMIVGVHAFLFLYVDNNATLIAFLKELEIIDIINFKQNLIEISLLIFFTIEFTRLLIMGHLNYFPSIRKKIIKYEERYWCSGVVGSRKKLNKMDSDKQSEVKKNV